MNPLSLLLEYFWFKPMFDGKTRGEDEGRALIVKILVFFGIVSLGAWLLA